MAIHPLSRDISGAVRFNPQAYQKALELKRSWERSRPSPELTFEMMYDIENDYIAALQGAPDYMGEVELTARLERDKDLKRQEHQDSWHAEVTRRVNDVLTRCKNFNPADMAALQATLASVQEELQGQSVVPADTQAMLKAQLSQTLKSNQYTTDTVWSLFQEALDAKVLVENDDLVLKPVQNEEHYQSFVSDLYSRITTPTEDYDWEGPERGSITPDELLEKLAPLEAEMMQHGASIVQMGQEQTISLSLQMQKGLSRKSEELSIEQYIRAMRDAAAGKLSRLEDLASLVSVMLTVSAPDLPELLGDTYDEAIHDCFDMLSPRPKVVYIVSGSKSKCVYTAPTVDKLV